MQTPIVAASDEAYAPHFAALLHSLAIHCKGQKLWFFDCGLKRSTKDLLLQFARRLGTDLQWQHVDLGALARFPVPARLSSAAYARILIPELLPDDVEQVLYLDVDCIVAGDLSPLLEIDLGSLLLAGVPNPGGRETEGPDMPDYVNTGVMLMNLTAWRQEGVAAKVVKNKTEHLSWFVDQPAINLVAAGRKMLLGSEWNLMTGEAARPDWRELLPATVPKIVHFTGSSKPSLYSDVVLGEIYRVHREATPFPLPPLRGERNPLRVALYVALRRKGYLQRHQFDRYFRRSFVEPYLAKLTSA